MRSRYRLLTFILAVDDDTLRSSRPPAHTLRLLDLGVSIIVLRHKGFVISFQVSGRLGRYLGQLDDVALA